MFHELRAQIAYSDCGGSLSYYRTPSGTEVDFIWSRGKHSIGIEVKASRQWRPEFGRALRTLKDSKTVTACYAAYLGDSRQQDGPVSVLPVFEFLNELSAGRILPGARRTRPHSANV